MTITGHYEFYLEKKKYNPDTSEYDLESKLVGIVPCNVTDLGIDRSIQLFGKYDESKKVVRPFKTIDFNWSYLEIDGVKYIKKSSLSPLNINALVVGAKSE